MNRILILFTLFLLYLYFPSIINAVTLNILDYPSEINNNNDEFTIKLEIIGANEGTNYLRLELFKDGTHNYFGETHNGDDWYGGSDGLKYFPVEIASSSATFINFEGTMGYPNTTDYPGKGTYKLRVQRYTASGNAADDDQQIKDVQINIALPTPIPTPDPSPTPKPTSTPKPTPAKSPSPIASPVNKIKPTPTGSPKINSSPSGDILGEIASNSGQIKASPVAASTSGANNNTNYLGWIFFAAGILLSSSAGLLAFQKAKDLKSPV